MKRTRQDPWYVRWTLTLAALAVLTVLVIVPLVAVFANAFAGGLRVYWENLTDPDTRRSILLTLAVAPTAVALNLAFGLAAAWLIARFSFRGRTALLTLIDTPFSISPVVAG